MSQAPQPPAPGEPPSDSAGSNKVWIYLGVGIGVALLAVVLFLALRPDDSEPVANTTSAPQTTTVETTTEVTTEETTTTEQTTTTTPSDQPTRVNVEFRNGEVVGGLVREDVVKDSQVVLVVRADVVDEVHLHGYDLFADVAPGQAARITFRANEDGEFEAELEDLGVPIAVLTVS